MPDQGRVLSSKSCPATPGGFAVARVLRSLAVVLAIEGKAELPVIRLRGRRTEEETLGYGRSTDAASSGGKAQTDSQQD